VVIHCPALGIVKASEEGHDLPLKASP